MIQVFDTLRYMIQVYNKGVCYRGMIQVYHTGAFYECVAYTCAHVYYFLLGERDNLNGSVKQRLWLIPYYRRIG